MMNIELIEPRRREERKEERENLFFSCREQLRQLKKSILGVLGVLAVEAESYFESVGKPLCSLNT
ncbi:MAG: hypothetical protein CVU57_15720 [Deltaproteobacteria bacterium HGW-Deltaproteobacteria-15]|jgi:hypothetical protein|nr:MAG: hypothetical protein CVU57_15720 [Deltaproteobacteria bacterium HGW-Deltaproteobacteria-15]